MVFPYFRTNFREPIWSLQTYSVDLIPFIQFRKIYMREINTI